MGLEKIIRKFALITGISLMTAIPFSRCEREDVFIHQPTHLSNISATKIAGGLNSPSGLSSNYVYGSEKSGIKSIQGDNLIVLAQGPTFYHDSTNTKIDLIKSIGPKINQILGGFDSPVLDSSQPLANFPIKDYFLDFNGPALILDNLVLQDGSILFSSNSSDKIFTANPIGVYLQEEKLNKITDIQGINGKIYVAEAPSIGKDGLVYTPKRVVSIDNKLITVEFNLPSENKAYNLPEYETGRVQVYGFEQLKIVENSKLGKEKFGIEYYVADMLENSIYGIASQKIVKEFKVRFPNSLAVDSVGDVIYTTSPLRAIEYGKYSNYSPSLCMLNPETKESTILYIFKNDNNEEDFFTGVISLYVKYNGKEYELPGGVNISNILYESENKIDFLFTNSNQGNLMKLTANKY